jgi:hypothetical protein
VVQVYEVGIWIAEPANPHQVMQSEDIRVPQCLREAAEHLIHVIVCMTFRKEAQLDLFENPEINQPMKEAEDVSK